jgi:flavin reductase (DIM6/NTAB) family NADH-FMN oxidoreductase RutF
MGETLTITVPSPAVPGIDPERFKQIFRNHPAGVVVVTVDAGRGPAGFTATSLTSLSLHPPLVSFGIGAGASSWPHVEQARTAVVNFLGAGQEAVARTFATSGIDRFAAPTHWDRLPTGEPVLTDAAAWLRIAIEHRHPAGTSHLVVGRIEEAGLNDSAGALLYHDGIYHSL